MSKFLFKAVSVSQSDTSLAKPFNIYRILPLTSVPVVLEADLNWHSKFRLIITRMVQSFRLMVGVHDYHAYLGHMQQHHPQRKVMTEKQFHQYCLEARYPTQAGKVGKCPC